MMNVGNLDGLWQTIDGLASVLNLIEDTPSRRRALKMAPQAAIAYKGTL